MAAHSIIHDLTRAHSEEKWWHARWVRVVAACMNWHTRWNILPLPLRVGFIFVASRWLQLAARVKHARGRGRLQAISWFFREGFSSVALLAAAIQYGQKAAWLRRRSSVGCDDDPFERLPKGCFEDAIVVTSKIADCTDGHVWRCTVKPCATSYGLAALEGGDFAVKAVRRGKHPALRLKAEGGCAQAGPLMSKLKGQTQGSARVVSAEEREESQQFQAYMRSLVTLTQEHVVQYERFFADEDFYYFVMHAYTGGTMLERLFQKDAWTEDAVRGLMAQLFSAVNYVHGCMIIHRDVKLENIVFETPSPDAPLRLIDFGIGCFSTCAEGTCGTYGYMAPEVLRGGYYGPTVDCFSLGVVMALLLTGRPPYAPPVSSRRVHMQEHLELLAAGPNLHREPWPKVSPLAKSLVAGLLQAQGRRRLTSHEALTHDWFSTSLCGTSRLQNRRKTFPLETLAIDTQNRTKSGLPVLWQPAESDEMQFLRVMGVWKDSSHSGSSSLKRGNSGNLDPITEGGVSGGGRALRDLCGQLVQEMVVSVLVADATVAGMPIVGVSRGFEELMLHNAEEVLGQNFAQVLGDQDDSCEHLPTPGFLERLRMVVAAGGSKGSATAAQGLSFCEIVPLADALPGLCSEPISPGGNVRWMLLHVSYETIGDQCALMCVQVPVDPATTRTTRKRLTTNSRGVRTTSKSTVDGGAAGTKFEGNAEMEDINIETAEQDARRTVQRVHASVRHWCSARYRARRSSFG